MGEVTQIGARERRWRINHKPLANVQATKTKATPTGLCSYNVLTALSVSVCGDATGGAAWQGTVAVIDGDSGGSDFLWGPMDISIPAVAGAMNGFAISGLWEEGTPGRALTIEFNQTAGAHNIQSVWARGVER